MSAIMSMGIGGASGGDLDPGPTVIQIKLLKRASRLLVIILGKITSASKTEEILLNIQAIEQFREVLGELGALWEQNRHDPPLRCRLSTCAAELEAVLETSCDFLYRLTYSK